MVALPLFFVVPACDFQGGHASMPHTGWSLGSEARLLARLVPPKTSLPAWEVAAAGTSSYGCPFVCPDPLFLKGSNQSASGPTLCLILT